MTDIVQQLRRYAGELCISTPAEMEAADEIERLRAELAAAQQQAAAYRFIRGGGVDVVDFGDMRNVITPVMPRGKYCCTPEEFDAVIFAAMENDNG